MVQDAALAAVVELVCAQRRTIKIKLFQVVDAYVRAPISIGRGRHSPELAAATGQHGRAQPRSTLLAFFHPS
jgi:hypothetical protein